jgi:hypothetical protein
MAGIEFAVHAVKITLRLALYVKSCANCMSMKGDHPIVENWSLDITGLQEKEADNIIEGFVSNLVRFFNSNCG